MSPHEQKLKK